MSKETIKLYSHDGNLVQVAKFHKDKQPEIGWQSGWFKSYDDAEEDLEFQKRVDFAIPNCDDKVKKDIKNLKNDLDVMKRLERLEDHQSENEINTEEIEKIGKAVTNNKREYHDYHKILLDRILKVEGQHSKKWELVEKNDKGQKMLLDRVMELESEVDGAGVWIFTLFLFSVVAFILSIIALVN